jgi:hypothetical protein
MARKLDIQVSGFGKLANSEDPATMAGFDTEATWLDLGHQRDDALALSPELEAWFAKELPIRPRS